MIKYIRLIIYIDMKLNTKGYLLVEIIVAFTIAMVMAYFLLQIVIDLKNINEDYFVDTKLETDQIILTKYIMDDITKYTLKQVEIKDQKTVDFTFDKPNNTSFKTRLNIENNIFKYGELSGNTFDTKKSFTKTLDSKLDTSTPVIKNLCLKNNEYKDCNTLSDTSDIEHFILSIKFNSKTLYSDKDYGIKIHIPYSKENKITIITYNPCDTSPIIVNCTNGANCELTNDNKILRILTNGNVEFNKSDTCTNKTISVALVGGGNGGMQGVTLNNFLNTIGGNGGNGGNGGKILIKNDYNIDLNKYNITIGSGGNSNSNGSDTIIKKTDNSVLLSSTTGTSIEGGQGGKSNPACQNIGYNCNFMLSTPTSGTTGNKITLADVTLDDIFGSSGGGGGAGANDNKANQQNGNTGGTNAGKGGNGGMYYHSNVTRAQNGTDGIENTGSGGGGGGGGGAGGYSHNNNPNFIGGSGGTGGSGILIFYNDNGWELK